MLTSSPTPMLNSCLLPPRDPSPAPEFQFLQRANSASSSSSVHSATSVEESGSKKSMSGSQLNPPPLRNQRRKTEIIGENEAEEEAKARSGIQMLFSISGLGEIPADCTDAYYEEMISADPGNATRLGKYATFLKEVRRDYGKAEEYYGRAILANPNDGIILALYADLIWEKDRDSRRAKDYFDQAVKIAPEDCYVMTSYARFLWDAEEEEN